MSLSVNRLKIGEEGQCSQYHSPVENKLIVFHFSLESILQTDDVFPQQSCGTPIRRITCINRYGVFELQYSVYLMLRVCGLLRNTSIKRLMILLLERRLRPVGLQCQCAIIMGGTTIKRIFMYLATIIRPYPFIYQKNLPNH